MDTLINAIRRKCGRPVERIEAEEMEEPFFTDITDTPENLAHCQQTGSVMANDEDADILTADDYEDR